MTVAIKMSPKNNHFFYLLQSDILLDQLIDFDILAIDLFGVSGQDDLIQFSSLTLNTFFDFFHFAAYFVHFTHRTSLNLSVLLHVFFCRASFSLDQYYCDGDNGYYCGKHLRYRKFDPRKQKLICTEPLDPESSDSVACEIK